MRAPLKRFYTTVTLVQAAEDASRLAVMLDCKPIKTPGHRILTLSHPTLAEAVATEWRAQGEKVEPLTMPLTRLAMSVVDHVVPRLDAVREEALSYGATDPLCYRAADPAKLVARQHAIWQPFLDWAADTLGARLTAREGIVAFDQDPAAMAVLKAAIQTLGPERLLALHSLTTRFGSLVLALAVIHGRASALEALSASRLDEIYQAELWGNDAEAEVRVARIATEVEDLGRFLALLA